MILDFSLEEFEEYVKSLGEQKFRAKQLFEGLLQNKTLDEISNLPNSFKEKIKNDYPKYEVVAQLTSKDGTQKVAIKFEDGSIVESVLLKYKYGNTVCVSTQVGCRMGCKFCASTLNGLKRNLSAGEILLQVLFFNRLLGGNLKERKVTNVVLMGCGEPLDNYENVCKFLKLVSSENGLNISQRNISLSTCGLVPNIKKLADDGFTVTLTISLHAPNDELRKTIMPIANAYKISEILNACDYYFDKTGRRICFEYSLIEGVNDSDACIKELASLMHGRSCHVNLIPLNSVKEKSLLGVARKKAYRIAEDLTKLGVSATVRRTMGEDIEGACGQLRNRVGGENV
ncbi:MAG: 23S rRNA (adenine(2503)-C(2))-methyltransferase RlmN [Clostridia bacterium]|nr:23S rRNA (adenine(2503)-C(2))-methyltransferase RlmN [Clostridia bacterium]